MGFTDFANGNTLDASQLDGNQEIATLSTGGTGLHISGRWYAAETLGRFASAASTLTLNRLYLLPFHVQKNGSYTGLSVMGGTASATMIMRMGIYYNNPTTGLPSTLLVDAGTTGAMSSATSQYVLTISQTLEAGSYWLAAVPQTSINAACITAVAPGTLSGGMWFMGYAAGYNANLPYAEIYATSAVSGALPASLVGGISYDSATRAPIVHIRKG